MQFTIYQVDAFAQKVFQGNPAAVVPLEEWLPDDLLRNIAAENNLSETAFFVKKADHYHLRWFTPAKEVRLCGHATLASAHVLFEHLGYSQKEIHFEVLAGTLKVRKDKNGYIMNFPADLTQDSVEDIEWESIIGVPVLDAIRGTDDVLVRIANYDQLQTLQPNFRKIAALDPRGLIVTTEGKATDVASRAFFPTYGIDEDPVTGSAHTFLTPYWSNILGKDQISFEQGGPRKGFLSTTLLGDRVELRGSAVSYLIGVIYT
jgi:PhzF family phenazine biosynthesis protein